MTKKHKWVKEEDKSLKDILAKEKHSKTYDDIKWDGVSKKMQKLGYNKSSKQCRERWIQQLNPTLTKEKWSAEENRRLLETYSEKGNHWKDISTHFKGRTDNATKNQFFSLIRKGLRKACKRIGRTSNTFTINNMKPKVLSEFFNMKVTIPPPEPAGDAQLRVLHIGSFIEKMAFGKKNEGPCSPQESYEITYIIDVLHKMNETYIEKKTSKREMEAGPSRSETHREFEKSSMTKRIHKKLDSPRNRNSRHSSCLGSGDGNLDSNKPQDQKTDDQVQNTDNAVIEEAQELPQFLHNSTEFEIPPKDLSFSENADNANNNQEESLRLDIQMDEELKKAVSSFNHQKEGGNPLELWSAQVSQIEKLRNRGESDKENDEAKWLDLSECNYSNFLGQPEIPSMNLNSKINLLNTYSLQPHYDTTTPGNDQEAASQNAPSRLSKENVMQNANRPSARAPLEKFGSSPFVTMNQLQFVKSLSKEPPEVLPASAEEQAKAPIVHSNSDQPKIEPLAEIAKSALKSYSTSQQPSSDFTSKLN